jgi:PAS domain S-box-containing protein
LSTAATKSPSPTNVVSENGFIFNAYPAFAKYIRENHLVEYITEQIELSYKLNLPMLVHIQHLSKEQLLEIGLPTHTDFLQAVENNRLKERLEKALKTWEDDEIGLLNRDDLSTEDITLGSYIRKMAQFKFLPLYTSDAQLMLEIIKEIEAYETESSTASTNTYINIFRQRINQHAYFIERIANTTPGNIYVYDLQKEQTIYSNTFPETSQDNLLHPEDALLIKADQLAFENAEDGEIRTIEFRGKQKDGSYKWSRSYRSVFKRNSDGKPSQIIGITIDIDEQMKRDESLKKSEAQLNTAQIQAGMGSFEWNIDDNTFHGSPNYYKLLGISADAKPIDIQKNVHPDDIERALAVRAKAIEEVGDYDMEYRYLMNGEEMVLWSRGSVDIKNGQKIFTGSLMDVTSKYQLLSQLQRSEGLYKQAQELGKIGNWTWDIQNDTIEWTDVLYRIFGMEPSYGAVTFREYISMIHPDDIEHMNSVIQKCHTEHVPYEVYHRLVMQDGSTKYVLSKGDISIDSKGNATKMFGTAQDVTKQQLTENRLRENREFIQKIANTTPSLITSFNANTGKFTYINSAAETLLGYSVEHFMEKGFEYFVSLIHPDDVDAIMAKHLNAVEEINSHLPDNDNEVVVEFKYRIRHADGSYKWFNTYGTIFDRNKEGKIEHILNVSVDVTEQMEAEEELNYKNFELQQSNASLGEYAYVASHDLKEPLRKIATFGDLLQTTQRELLTDSGKMYLDKIIRSAVRMQDMINDLLTVSTISGNKSFEDTDLNIIVDEVLQTLEYKIELKKAKITVDKLPHASIVPSQFSQLLQNLVSNSLKFANEDGEPQISITHKYIRPSEVTVEGVTPANMYLQIQVADNGIGFEKEFAHKIFTIFQRLHGKSEYEGTGIGLAICKKIAENHGGAIYANSDPGEGSVFTIIIPV